MCTIKNLMAILLAIGMFSGVCYAALGIEMVLAPQPGAIGGASYPSGYTSWDMMVTTTDLDLSAFVMYVDVDTPASGAFYQNPNGGITGPPSASTIAGDPPVEFDTYLTVPGSISLLGAATDLVSGQRPLTFDDQLLDIAWGLSVSSPPSGTGTFQVARITVRDDARGTWQLLAMDVSTAFIIESGSTGPHLPFFVPEPPMLLGDVNGDGFVDGDDLDTIISNWGSTGASRTDGDLTGDGAVSGTDYNEVLAYWGLATLFADVNDDGFVDDYDLNIVISNWGLTGASRADGDLTSDGTVGGVDYNEVLAYWEEGTPPPLEPMEIPEPATSVLLLIGGLARLRRRT